MILCCLSNLDTKEGWADWVFLISTSKLPSEEAKLMPFRFNSVICKTNPVVRNLWPVEVWIIIYFIAHYCTCVNQHKPSALCSWQFNTFKKFQAVFLALWKQAIRTLASRLQNTNTQGGQEKGLGGSVGGGCLNVLFAQEWPLPKKYRAVFWLVSHPHPGPVHN